MASIRNYNAWIKAARKASAKTGGLSLPAARKAYRKMAERLGRPLKGVDVKKHPRIFKESIPVRSGGRKPIKRRAPVRKPMLEERAAPAKPAVAKRKVAGLGEFERLGPDAFLGGTSEFVSTAEYGKSK